jgi:RIO-like serine/threonine protein kinase
MKLDVNVLRYLSKEEFRVLTAVEMGMKNHEIVPAELVDRIAGLKHGGAFKNMKTLLRHKLVHHDSSKCMSILCERRQVGGLVRD